MKCLLKCLCSKKFVVFGPNGGISTKLYLPQTHVSDGAKYPLVILMHGFAACKDRRPINSTAKLLAKNGYAALTFDFNGHGKSEGKFIDMTVTKEIEDARAVFDYACTLPFVKNISFLGHSQGGVVAGMLAGQLEQSKRAPKCLIQLAPAAVLKDDALEGKCMFSKYDPKDPPEYVNVLFHKLGRNFILEAQKLDIIGTSAGYCGNVCLIHGKKDRVVPVSYSRQYDQSYRNSELHVLDEETHFFNMKTDDVNEIILDFLKSNLQA